MIGWYVHSHGLGHLQRVGCVAPHLHTPVTILSSAPLRPLGPRRVGATAGGRKDTQLPWVELPDDLPLGDERDVTAGGTLHWAPVHHPGLRQRMAAIAAWVEAARPALVVVDVSVEVALLVRSMGVPVVVVGMRGDRSDRAHATAYDLAAAVLAPWPAAFAEPWPQRWLDKTWHVGGVSRFDGRSVVPPPRSGQVALLWGQGGSAVSEADVAAAVDATPGWRWTTAGLGSWADDTWALLAGADVVVTHAGQGAIGEVAAARRPAVVLPQPRPHDEQCATGRAMAQAGLAVVREAWPEPHEWPQLLDAAARLGGGGWERWSDGSGAQRAAELLDDLAVTCAPR